MSASSVINIGSRCELFIDDWLIERVDGVERRLHHPVPVDVAVTFDQPWEGPNCCYVTVFQDTDRYRMYYSCYPLREFTGPNQYIAYAESDDGIIWRKPVLGLIDFQGSRANNLIIRGTDGHTFAPFIDANPAATEDMRYKAVAGNPPHLMASGDGIHWHRLSDAPLISARDCALGRLGIDIWEIEGRQEYAICDSHNLAFWDAREDAYVCYFRGWRKSVRTFLRSRSADFLVWSDPETATFSDPPTVLTQFYTNGVHPYFRAPHLYVALPMRFTVRPALAPAAGRDGVAEVELMCSRDGMHFLRDMDAFVSPGLDRRDWNKHNNMMAWGMLNLVPEEISLFYTRHHYAPTAHLQRAVLRADGFISRHAPFTGGELITHPLIFSGDRLEVNVSTGAAGSLRIEIQDVAGQPIKDFTLSESREFYGDQIDYVAEWNSSPDIRRLAGQPIRLRFVMKDADLFAMRFQ
jgi:hypothetical protein